MVERERARFGAWYEMFPRSAAAEPGRHGTFRDVEARLPYVAEMGFDVLYLPPIHPIGRAFRKGPNNTLTPGPNDPGSPWAIGGARGGAQGHPPRARDARRLRPPGRRGPRAGHRDRAGHRLPVLARPSLRPASTPSGSGTGPTARSSTPRTRPRSTRTSIPIDFECADWQALWAELRDVFLFWIGHGVTIFRVDNPHTKPFRFWEWVHHARSGTGIPTRSSSSEAFTRPEGDAAAGQGRVHAVVHLLHLAEHQAGADRVLHRADPDASRPSTCGRTCSPTRPTSCHEYLQIGGRPAFMIRLVLAATLGATYGIYGPPFEQCVGTPVRPGSEEYLDSEKYQVRHWDLDAPGSLRDYVARINEIRRENPALHYNRNLRFFDVDNDADHLLRQVDPRPVEPDPGRRQPRPVPHAVGLGAAPRARAGPGLRPGRVVPGPRPDQRRALPLARRVELRRARPPASAPRTSSGCGGRSGPSTISITSCETRRIDSSSDGYPERLRPATHRRGDPRPRSTRSWGPTSSTSTARPARISPSGRRTRREVSVIGDFNGWNPAANPLSRRGMTGVWAGFVPAIGHGDAVQVLDPRPRRRLAVRPGRPLRLRRRAAPRDRLEGLGPRRLSSGATPTGWPTAPPASR